MRYCFVNNKTLIVKMSDKLFGDLAAIAEKEELGKSQVVRLAIRRYIQTEGDKFEQ